MKAMICEAEWAPRPGYVLSEREKRERRASNGNQVWKNPKLSVKEIPTPKIMTPKDVIIKVKVCAVCGSDVHMMETDEDGYIKLAYNTKFPCALGHEFSGEVLEIGSEVKRVKVGDMVSIEEINWCANCAACSEGYPNQCQNIEDFGFTINGAFAEYLVSNERYIWKLNSVMEAYQDKNKVFEAGALVEPTSVSYEGLFTRGGGIRPGGHVAVFGTGPIGLAAVALAKTSGAAKIIAFEISDVRRKLAREMGADYVYDPQELKKLKTTMAQAIMDATDGAGAHLLVEATGASTIVMPEVEKALEHGAKVIILGITPNPAPVSLVNYQVRGAKIVGSSGHCGDFQRVINLMASKRIDMTRIITNRFSLDNAVEAIKQTAKAVDGKVLVKPG